MVRRALTAGLDTATIQRVVASELMARKRIGGILTAGSRSRSARSTPE